VQYFVHTLFQATQASDGPFKLPVTKLNFIKCLTVMLDRMPPNTAICIKNGRPLPEHFRKRVWGEGSMAEPSASRKNSSPGERRQADTSYISAKDYYHGYSLHDAVDILMNSFKVNTGAG